MQLKTLLGIFLSMPLLLCCKKDFITIGNELFENQQLTTNKISLPVSIYQRRFKAFQSNGLPLAQLGKISHPVFGQNQASMIAQAFISPNPRFGLYTEEQETEGDITNPNVIRENERVEAVFLEIPFFNNRNDADNDGVIDALDADPNDPSSDTDQDGISDFIETSAGLDPLNQDSDNDGILDPDDTENSGFDSENNVYEIDSVYGNRNAMLSVKVHQLTYFLNPLDVSNNFESPSAYFSNQNLFEQGFFGTLLFEGPYQLNFEELRFNFKEDDVLTPDVDETQQVETRLSPRIRIPLNNDFFQTTLLNNEGNDVLSSQNNFSSYFRGLIIQAIPQNDDLYMLLNFDDALIRVQYSYDRNNDMSTGDLTDDVIFRDEAEFLLTLDDAIFFSNVTYSQFPQVVLQESDNSSSVADKIFIHSGLFSASVRLFESPFDQDKDNLLNTLRNNRWIINQATLTFLADEQSTETDPLVAQRLYLYNEKTNQVLEDYRLDPSVDIPKQNINRNIFGGLLDRTDAGSGRYSFNITNHVANIVRRDSANVSLGLCITANIDNNINIKALNAANDGIVKIPQAAVLNPFGVVLQGASQQNTGSVSTTTFGAVLELLYTEY